MASQPLRPEASLKVERKASKPSENTNEIHRAVPIVDEGWAQIMAIGVLERGTEEAAINPCQTQTESSEPALASPESNESFTRPVKWATETASLILSTLDEERANGTPGPLDELVSSMPAPTP